MLLKALLVALIATCSSWWFSHAVTRTWLYPLWSGFLVGLAMGQPLAGMQAAAYINLAYLGWITAGGTMPGNLMVAGVFGTALTLISGADPKLAVTFAVPFSLLGIISWQGYMTINALWVHRAEKYAAEGNLRGVRLMNYLPSFLVSLVLNGIPAFVLVYFGGDLATNLINSIPEPLIKALSTVGAIMPALGISMLLNYMGKPKLIPFFFLGFFLAAYFKLDVMAITIFAAVIAVVLYLFGNQNKKAPEVSNG